MNKIKGERLKVLKDLIEQKSTGLNPKPKWSNDPRSMIEPSEIKPGKLFGNYDMDDLFGQYPDIEEIDMGDEEDDYY